MEDSRLKLLLVYLSFFFSFECYPAVHVWSPEESRLYQSRRFTELAQILTLKGNPKIGADIGLQDQDLPGCKSLHAGKGGLNQFVDCVSFLKREEKLGLLSRGRPALIEDMNILCDKLVKGEAEVGRVLRTRLFNEKTREWEKCRQIVWRQVYLTTYANFQALPVKTLSFVRLAQKSLYPDNHWDLKTFSLVGLN